MTQGPNQRESPCAGVLEGWNPGLAGEDRRLLLKLARETLQACVEHPHRPLVLDAYAARPALTQPFCTFVTLKKGGALRGCVGSLFDPDPLYRSVYANTIGSALRDPRFPPVSAAEVPRIAVRISVLSPLEPIASLEDFKPGEHGILLRRGSARSVFLPEVAPEQGWDRQETAACLCLKAGLDTGAWRHGAQFQVFRSVAIDEAPDTPGPDG